MTEVEYVLTIFPERFADFQNKRIVLHGSRNYAEAIIANYADKFNFIGIMSLDPINGEYFHGLKVLYEKDLPALNVDMIILTERVKYAVNAFYSIRRTCKENRIAIRNMYGLDEYVMHCQAESTPSFDLEEAKKMCAPYDIIAFGVINTIFYSPQGISDVSARKLFIDLIKHLRRQKKEIRFLLQKSYPADIQEEELREFGFLQNEAGEIIPKEGEDHSFRKLKDNNPGKKILFIGSSLAYDFILPRCYGIDTRRFIESYNPANLVSRHRKRKIQKGASFYTGLKEVIKTQILQKELISFDIFDTLLIRKTLYPRDVFFLTERKALLAGFDVKGFVSARVRAEDSQTFCNIYQIYDWLREYYGWDEATTQKVLKIETDTEREMLVPRTEVTELLHFARKKGKRVVLTSDMYYPEAFLQKFLTDNGITGYDKILVSCDVKKSKHTGLYEELAGLCDEIGNILHIGDNPVSDGTDCQAAGFSSILIPSVLEMARNRGWAKSIQTASSLMERCLLGLVLSKVFRDPFQNPDYEKSSGNNQLWRFSLCVVAPLVVGHMTWLIRKLQKEKFAGVLFFARDGWLSFNIYKIIQERFNLPQPVYYYANRKSASLCCLDRPQEMDSVTEKGKMVGLEATDILKNIFQIPEEQLLPHLASETELAYIEKHLPRIHENAEKARKGYLRYSERCGIKPGNSYAVIDFVTVGTVHNYLSKVLPFRFKGFFFGCYSPASLSDDGTDYYLQKNNPLLLNRYVELESFFSSPEPSLKCMGVDGEPVFEPERRNRQELQDASVVWESAKSFSREFFDIFYCIGEYVSPDLIEEMYATKDYCIDQYSVFDEWLGVPHYLNRHSVYKEQIEK